MTKNLEEFGGVNTASKRSAATTTDGMMHGSEVNEPAVSPVPGPAVCLELLNTCRSQGKRKQEKRQQPQLAVAGVNSAAVNQPGPGRADRCRARFEAAGRAHVAVRARAYDRCGEPGGEPAGRPAGGNKAEEDKPRSFCLWTRNNYPPDTHGYY